jgi:hypothetical protein
MGIDVLYFLLNLLLNLGYGRTLELSRESNVRFLYIVHAIVDGFYD